MGVLHRIFKVETKPTERIFHFLGFQIKRVRKMHVANLMYNTLHYTTTVSTSPENFPKARGMLYDVQRANLYLLKLFDRFCAEKQLRYWLDFGTLLGAKRHGGFYPWDDDLDVSMMREDYDKVVDLFQNWDGDFIARHKNPSRGNTAIKIVHKKIPHIWLDIVPWDYYQHKLTYKEHNELHHKIEAERNKKRFRKATYENVVEYYKNIRDDIILKNETVDKTSAKTVFLGCEVGTSKLCRVRNLDGIFPLSTVEFEKLNFSCPRDVDYCLTSLYGDYMVLPRYIRKHAIMNDLTLDEIMQIKEYRQKIDASIGC